MGVLINMSKNLEHTEVLEAHKLLLEGFNFSDGLNFPLTNSYNGMFYVVTDLGEAIVESISEVLLRLLEVLQLRVRDWHHHFLETVKILIKEILTQ